MRLHLKKQKFQFYCKDEIHRRSGYNLSMVYSVFGTFKNALILARPCFGEKSIFCLIKLFDRNKEIKFYCWNCYTVYVEWSPLYVFSMNPSFTVLSGFKGAVSQDFFAFFISWIKAIWAPDKQVVKTVLPKSSFLRRYSRKIRLCAG